MANEQDPWVQRGGQEPPPEVEDRPEQNAGYDEAVRGGVERANLDPAGLDEVPAVPSSGPGRPADPAGV